MAQHIQITDIDTTDDMPASKGYVDGIGGASALDDLTDVSISSPSTGQVLKFNGTNWENGTDATGGGGGLSDGDYGDITVSSSGTVMNIDAGAVTTTELGGDITSAGKALLDDADAAAQLVTLGLSATATELNYTDGVTSAIQTQLDGKAASSHTHTSSNITDFDEAVEDKIGAKVVAGTGISVTYDDTSGETTVENTQGADWDAIVAPSGGTHTTVKAALDDGAVSILVKESVTETASITNTTDEVFIKGLNRSVVVTLGGYSMSLTGRNVSLDLLTFSLAAGSITLGENSTGFKCDIVKSGSASTPILVFDGKNASWLFGGIEDLDTTLTSSRVILKEEDIKFFGVHCYIADCGTTTSTAWLRTSNVSGDTGAKHKITHNYFFSGSTDGVKTAWTSGALLIGLQYADGSIAHNTFEGPVSTGVAIRTEDYHESITSNYFNGYDTQLYIPEDIYRIQVNDNMFAQPSGRCIECNGYGNSFMNNTISCTNQTIKINPGSSASTKGRQNSFIGGEIRAGSVSLGANSQDNSFIGVSFLNYSTTAVSDSGTTNRYFMNTGTNAPADNVSITTGYSFQDEDNTGTYIYVGYKKSAGNWYIYRRTVADNTREYASGTSNYSTNWTNRGSLTYA